VSNEAKFRLRLDTDMAKRSMDALVKKGKSTGQKLGSDLRSSITGGLGLGAGIGAGMAAIKGTTASGFGDVVSESLGGLGAQLSEFFLGDLPQDARASRAAREETIQAFGAIAGATGEIPPGAKQFFDSVRSLRMQEETGRHMINKFDDFRGKGLEELINRIMTGLSDLLRDAVDALAEKLKFW
jgi:hypothetical protein